MRFVLGFAVIAVCCVSFGVPAAPAEPDEREFLDKLERQVQKAATAAEPSVACIVVSRSELYPKTPRSADEPGKLGEFDPEEFTRTDKSPERVKLAKRLDLSYYEGIPNHGVVGGVVIDASGLVMTTYHAIDGAARIYVHLPRKNGAGPVGSYADIFAADSRSGLAVLKLIHPPPDLKPIAIARVHMDARGVIPPNIARGKLIGLMANPYISGFTLGSASFSYGSITNVRKRLPEASEHGLLSESFFRYGRFLEFSVLSKESDRKDLDRHGKPGDRPNEKMNELVDGGALINLDGELIGMTTAGTIVDNRAVGPGYAIPMDDSTHNVVAALRKGEEVDYGFLGITLGNDQLTPPSQIAISNVMSYSPADFAGLDRGDVITAINDVAARDYQDLLLYAGNALAGAQIKLSVVSHGSSPVYLTLGKYNNKQPFIASVRPEPVFGLRVDYLSVLVQQQQPSHQNHAPVVRGVCVRELVPNSPAAKQFKTTLGDNSTTWFITHVNGEAVANPAEFYAAAKGKASVKLKMRDWNENRRELTLP